MVSEIRFSVPRVSSGENDRIQPGKKVKDSAWVAVIDSHRIRPPPSRHPAASGAGRASEPPRGRAGTRRRRSAPTPCVERTTSGVPTQASSAWMRRLKAG